MVRIFSAKLIPLHTQGWEDGQSWNILIWKWYSSKHCFNVSRALQENLPLSFGHGIKLFLWFWIMLKAFLLCATLREIKLWHADLTRQPLPSFKEPDTSLGGLSMPQFNYSLNLRFWHQKLEAVFLQRIWLMPHMCQIDTPRRDPKEIMSDPCLRASFHILNTPVSTSDFLWWLSPYPTLYN